MKTRHTFREYPSQVPAEWTIWNAPRPIYGDITWKGDFLSGVFYAAINPDGDDCKRFTQLNIELDACKIFYVDEEEALDLMVTYYQDSFKKTFCKDEYRDELLQGYLNKYNK
jgi:hypothetical protein